MSRRLMPSRSRALRARVVCPPAELRLYRERTLELLRRYYRLSLELGRLPSLLGREFFRSSVTTLCVPTFEDLVIFVHDMEVCLERLDKLSRQLIARIVFQEYTGDETAVLLGCDRRTVTRRYPDALDELTAILLDLGLLRPLAGHVEEASQPRSKTCQEPKNVTLTVTPSKDGK
ncbi:MAG TPA: hypothetical protein VNK82_10100 [Terriglobales bacterium]|nr:hypothetical protein [Terriglobales bacterium]